MAAEPHSNAPAVDDDPECDDNGDCSFSSKIFKDIKDTAWMEHDLNDKLADPAKGPLRSFLNIAARALAYFKYHEMKDSQGTTSA